MNSLHDVPRLRNTIREFLNCLFEPEDLVELRLLPPGNSNWHQAKDLHFEADTLARQNQAGQQIFFGANPRNTPGRKTEHVKLARSLFADFDHTDIVTVRNRLEEIDIPQPTVIVNSGHGVHYYWRLEKPIDDLVRWTRVQKRLARLLNSDAKVCDPPRIMRLPGFKNLKEPVALAELIEARQEIRCQLAVLENLLPELQPTVTSVPQQTSVATAVEKRAIAYLSKCEPSISGKGGHDHAFAAARSMVLGFDLGVEKGLELMMTHFNPRCKPPWSEDELRHKCQDANSKPFDKPRGWLIKATENPQYNDLWNARKMLELHGYQLRYIPSWKKWLIWDGIRWHIDEDGEVMRRAKNTVDHLQKQADIEETTHA